MLAATIGNSNFRRANDKHARCKNMPATMQNRQTIATCKDVQAENSIVAVQRSTAAEGRKNEQNTPLPTKGRTVLKNYSRQAKAGL